jgi:hypothetical protein
VRPAGRWDASDLPVQPSVSVGVDDLHDDIRADVDVMGDALSSGQGAGVAT